MWSIFREFLRDSRKLDYALSQQFATTTIQYLGHTLTPEGVRPNETKIAAVKDFPRPQCVKQVKSFLGLANFYRQHIPNMAAISRSLTNLTRKENLHKFEWTPECTTAFEEIKKQLVTAPLVHPPDMEKEFLLWTDTSEKGFGAVLEQEDAEGHRHPIACHQLSRAEVCSHGTGGCCFDICFRAFSSVLTWE